MRENTSPRGSKINGTARPSSQLGPACRSRTSKTAAAVSARFQNVAVDGVLQVSRPLAEGIAGNASSLLNCRAPAARSAPTISCCRARTELHYHVNRPLDVLGKNLQPAVALGLGYGERRRACASKKFMRDLYTHMRNIFLITRTLEQRMALLPPPQNRLASLRAWLPKRTRPVEPVDGFLLGTGKFRAASNRVFRDQPRRLMRVFLHAQQHSCNCIPTSRSSSATSFRSWTVIFERTNTCARRF